MELVLAIAEAVGLAFGMATDKRRQPKRGEVSEGSAA
jgi:hypothetical protein